MAITDMLTRLLHVRSAQQATLSPDGTDVSFITSTTGMPQLWAQDTGGGVPRQLTFGSQSVTFQEWSPGGEWIVYGADRAGDEREGFYLVSPDGLREHELVAPSEAFRTWGGWSPNARHAAFSSTERNGEDFDVYVVDVHRGGSPSPGSEAPAPRLVAEGRGGLYAVSWRPDGKALMLASTRGEAGNDLHLLDLATGERDMLFAPDEASAYHSISWTRDGRGFYMVTNHERDLAALVHYDVATRTLEVVEAPPHEVEGAGLSHDGRWLAWSVNENGYSELHVRDLHTNAPSIARPALPRGVYDVHWAPHAPVLAAQVAGPTVPGDVWTIAPYASRSARVTRSATGGLDPEAFVAPEAVSFASWDGETIHGLLYLPVAEPDVATGASDEAASRRPPVVVGLHGGPTAQARPEFDPLFQYLLTRGIAVLDLNFRGSTGYGKRFTHLDDRRRRPDAVQDMSAALDWLADTGRVDATRAAAMGASYGGYMTFAALTQLPERFRAGVGLVGVSNWVTALEGASPALRASDREEYGDVDDPDDRAFFVELSPITHVDNVRAPLMVVHGANDPRDPVGEADQLVDAIRGRGGRVEYLRLDDEGHGIRKLANRVLVYRRIAEFLEEALG